MKLLFRDDPLFEKTVQNLLPQAGSNLAGLYSNERGFCWVFQEGCEDFKLGMLWSFKEEAVASDLRYVKLKLHLKANYPEMLL